ncbi:MAG TPA: competence/damage-inducible protein A [Clostridiaceae bacterium]|jgi:nicotinamide-nucleotide amidase|nr:competence/damage-inducible protein A [Clostridiaceae bacterium]HCL49626.1 competence/damage-inducible protein A [Clostridiaceae bacterium]
MNVEIISVGTELLLGNILNTDAQYISRRLSDIGLTVYFQTVVGDNKERLKKAFKTAYERADIIITSGGLGPTNDDLTKETGAEYFNKKLVLDEKSLDAIKEYFKSLNRKIGEGNKKQAYFPEDAIIIPNGNGTAPGCIIEDGGKVLINLPGPPSELIPMFENGVMPYLTKYQDGVIFSKVLRVCGIGESFVAEKIKDILDKQTNPTVAPYAKEGEVTLRITAKGRDEEEAKRLIVPVEKEIRNILGDYVYGVGETTIEEVVSNMLIDKKLTLSVAESCTGGMIASRFINVSGASNFFIEGDVTYSNEAKVRRLGVKEETLKKFGAVSDKTAYEMAEGIARAAHTDIGLSTTGIAGPEGGTIEKPVGLVYIGLYFKGEITVKELHLKGNRQRVRNEATIEAIDMLRRKLINAAAIK